MEECKEYFLMGVFSQLVVTGILLYFFKINFLTLLANLIGIILGVFILKIINLKEIEQDGN